jgi:RNA polymerase sigma factor (sigma-70 family)
VELKIEAAQGRETVERELTRAAQAGELSAFEKIYRSTAGRIYAVCLRLSGRPEIADELVQETFVRAWRKLPGFRGESALTTWLTRIAVNVALSERKKSARLEDRLEEPGIIEELGVPRETGDAESSIDLERAIAALPPKARQVFVLHDVEGWKHEEIAERAGIAVGTSKAHLHKARAALKEALSP